jgi:hypothetical protein
MRAQRREPMHPFILPCPSPGHVRKVIAARQHASHVDGQPRVAVLLELGDFGEMKIADLHGRDDHFK